MVAQPPIKFSLSLPYAVTIESPNKNTLIIITLIRFPIIFRYKNPSFYDLLSYHIIIHYFILKFKQTFDYKAIDIIRQILYNN